MERFSRRKLLIGVGLLGLGTVLDAACKGGNGSQQSKVESPIQEITLDGRANLTENVQNLPPSVIKDLLVERVLPYFVSPPAVMKPYEGAFTFPVWDSTVTEHISNGPSESLLGTYTPRGNSTPPTSYELLDDLTVRVPIGLIVIDPQAREKFDGNHRMSDGTPVFEQSFGKGHVIYEGISPEIHVYHQAIDKVTPEKKPIERAFATFGFIKEACSMLLEQMANEDIYKNMKKYGLPTTVTAKNSIDGSFSEVQALQQAMATIYDAGGTWQAANDIGGYILAFKALEGTDILNNVVVGSQGTDSPVVDELKSLDLGQDADSVLHNSYNWILTHPVANILGHVGNLYNIP